jgi:hypothetical protein
MEVQTNKTLLIIYNLTSLNHLSYNTIKVYYKSYVLPIVIKEML